MSFPAGTRVRIVRAVTSENTGIAQDDAERATVGLVGIAEEQSEFHSSWTRVVFPGLRRPWYFPDAFLTVTDEDDLDPL